MQTSLEPTVGAKETFIDLFTKSITRPGADELLKYLLSPQSDFFTAPASTRFHLASPEGLVTHSLNVFQCLLDYLERARVKDIYGINPSLETIAIVGLLHDVCKINVYQKSSRNVKNAQGQWEAVPYYDFHDPLPYGHGEKSVYIITGFMKLTREEAFAIRYHMGFTNQADAQNVGAAFEQFPLALALSIADMEASFLVEARQ